MEHVNEQPEKPLADSRPTPHAKSASGTGKKKKHFLGQNDALSLAASIGEIQEKKSAAKIPKPTTEVQSSSTPKPKKLSARHRVKEKKALLQAQRAEAKKNKVKNRKKEKPSEVKVSQQPSAAKRKGVSFAE